MSAALTNAMALVLAALGFAGTATAEPAPKAAPQPSFNTPPELPADYRSKVAAMLVEAYLQEGRGRPQISEVNGVRGLVGASSGFCVRYPADVSFDRFRRSDMRVVFFTAHHDIMSGGQVTYKASYGPAVTCEATKTWMPFPELERAAAGQKRQPR